MIKKYPYTLRNLCFERMGIRLKFILGCIAIIIIHLFAVSLTGQSLVPGTVYYDSENEYVEYIYGNLPIVISAPHGGEKKPEQIEDRDCEGCITINDSYTQELTRKIVEELVEITGCYPHVIINRLHRSKMDANRGIREAADGNEAAEMAWTYYHNNIDTSLMSIAKGYGRGIFIDLHGHAHANQRLELGYLMSTQDLKENDEHLNETEVVQRSSIRNLAENNLMGLTHAELIRGQHSMGSLLVEDGFASVPSENDSNPVGNEAYFKGGYNTDKYGSKDGGNIDAIQIECNQDVRFNQSVRTQLARSIAISLLSYLELHYFNDFASQYCNTTPVVTVEHPEISIYPNPFKDYVQVKNLPASASILVYDIMGQLMIDMMDINEGDQLIDLSEIHSGIYFIVIRNKNGSTYTFKTVKER